MVLHVRYGKGSVPRDIALSPALLDDCAFTFAIADPRTGCFRPGGMPLRLSTSARFVTCFVRRLSAPASNAAFIPIYFGMPALRTCSMRARTCGRFRSCSGMLIFERRPGIYMFLTSACTRFAALLMRSPFSPSIRPEITKLSHERTSAGSGRCLSPARTGVLCSLGRYALGSPAQSLPGHSRLSYRRSRRALRTVPSLFSPNLRFLSCRNRHCPKCQSTARDQWLDRTAKELQPVPYSHVIFTLPGGLAPLVRQNAVLIYNLLFRCVAETLLTIARDPSRLGADLGFLSVLHTWNQKMLTHPHLHCLVPFGGLSPDRSHWVHSRKRFFLPGPVLGRLFRGTFLALLAIAFRRKKLRLMGELLPLQQLAAFDRFVRSLKKHPWVVEVRAPFGGPEHVLKYLARYTHRVAISNGRLSDLRDGQVTFRWRDSADHNTQKFMTIEAIEFIRRFLLHVLPPGFVKIRHFGFLANCRRADGLKICRTLLQASSPLDLLTAPQRNAIERRCPCCGIGTLCFLGYVPAGVLNILMTPVSVRPDSS